MSRPPMPTIKVLYHVQPARGVLDRKLLSCVSDGSKVDLWNQDDYSGRQKWRFIEIFRGVYNIEVSSGVNQRRYLSSTPDGKVDLWLKDDGSGRQRWKLEPLTNGCFHIKVLGGTNMGKKFLSCTQDGRVVDLYHSDDNSGRQQWKLFLA